MLNELDVKKFNKIYADTYPDVVKYVVINSSNIEDSEDIIQNIYIAVAKGIGKNAMTKKYIMGIAKNKIIDYYRFRYKEKEKLTFEENFEYLDAGVDIEKSMDLQYDTDKVWKYLTKKKAVIGKIFYLYYYEELTIKQIAKELKISDANVKNNLYRTLKELNKFLRKEMTNE